MHFIRTGGGEGRGPFEMLFLVTVLLGGWLGVVARLIMARCEMVIMIIVTMMARKMMIMMVMIMVARNMMIMMTVLPRLRVISILCEFYISTKITFRDNRRRRSGLLWLFSAFCFYIWCFALYNKYI